eukprot:16431420-Heterocapsa_arctica.AAC.1
MKVEAGMAIIHFRSFIEQNAQLQWLRMHLLLKNNKGRQKLSGNQMHRSDRLKGIKVETRQEYNK